MEGNSNENPSAPFELVHERIVVQVPSNGAGAGAAAAHAPLTDIAMAHNTKTGYLLTIAPGTA
jgi:hypothetical protein